MVTPPPPAPDSKEASAEGGPVSGIPEFWLTALKNTDIFADMIKVSVGEGKGSKDGG